MSRVTRIHPDGPQQPKQRVQPVQERSRRKIDAILDATANLLDQHGVDAISMSAIAEEAGIPPATVYHYFENRLAIFAALARRIIDSVDEELIRIIQAQLATGQPDIRMMLKGLYDAYARSPVYVKVLVTLRAEPALQDVVKESNQRSADVIAAMLAQHSSLPTARAKRIGWIVAETCEAVLQRALVSDKAEARALLDELTTVVECMFAYYSTLGAAKPAARRTAAAGRATAPRKKK